MALKKKIFRSTVADLTDFEPDENPPWRKTTRETFSTRKMIQEIVEMRQKSDSTRDTTGGRDDGIKRRLELEATFFYHCNVEEGHGLKSVDDIKKCLGYVSKGNESLSLEEQETVNLRDAYLYLKSEAEQDKEHGDGGLLEESMLRQVNKIILRNIARKECYTKAGTYSNNPRITQFRGETYYYQQPDDMQESVCVLLDRFNSLFTDAMSKTDEVDKLESIFKSVAWLVFELLDLHPFSDGNGRMCRLLCSYVLSTFTPFPSPIYNIYSSSTKEDFENALVKARKSETRYPCELTAMIIESNFRSWQIFDQGCPDASKSHDKAADSSSVELPTSLKHLSPRTSSNWVQACA